MANLDHYLPCADYSGHEGSEQYPGFSAWYNEADQHWYFGVVTPSGRTVLRSEGYTSESGRNNGIESVIRNRDIFERYAVVRDEADGLWYVVLRAGNRQEIARSCAYASEAEATAGIDSSFSTFTEKEASAGGVIDNYLPCESYEAAPSLPAYPGFKGWHDAATGMWYFCVTTPAGITVLRSEAYTTEEGRDDGIESVIRNRDTPEQYRVEQDPADGMWYVVLTAENGQEIARSCAYENETSANAGISRCFSTYSDARRARAAVAEGEIDNYLSCESYANAPASEIYEGYHAWKSEDDGQYYFAAVTPGGKVVLRSEGYTTEAARDNGIESVMVNRDNDDRYKVIQDEETGNWYTVLRAGNHQEIARSCAHASEAAANAGIAMTYSSYNDAKRARAAAAAESLDDYLPCEAYAEAPDSDNFPGFRSWYSIEAKQYYFAAITPGGRVTLRSEGYTSGKARDNGIASVMRNRDNADRYAVVKDENDGMWYVVLKAGNNQEIARSCGYDSEAGARAGIATSYSTYSDVITEKAVRGAVVIEDYLPCEAYEGKTVAKHPGFTAFTDQTTGLHYFAMVDDNGKILLKSEGYTNTVSRDNGVESVIRNRDNKDRWVQKHDEDGYYVSLRAGNRQEIARTCHYESEGALHAWWMPFSTSWAWGRKGELVEMKATPSLESYHVESKVSETPVKVEIEEISAPVVVVEEPKIEIEKVIPIIAAAVAIVPEIKAEPEIKSKKVVYTKPIEEPVYVPPVVAKMETEAAAGGGWWKWLLPLLLLALLAWLLMRGCDGCKKPAAVVVPKVEAPKAEVPVVPVPPPPPAKPTCNCNESTDAVFNLSNCTNPKSLSRLGTNPEFGNSHDLTPEQFHAKLASRYKASGTDKRFLDRMFKGMGYPEGFSAAKPEMFSAVEIPAGTVGNIGYSKQHKTLCARLDTQGKDLLAFRIEAANGCTLHFMKTCGNHFFFCPK